MAEVSITKRYELSADDMWRRIGDPGALADWHPGVEATELLDGGATRINTIAGGGRVVEPILEQADHSYTFRIVESPLPLSEFVSTISVRADGADGCVVEWASKFEPSGMSEDEVAEIIRGFFQAGLDAL